jgi:glycosyltransferase involved in cell wall biosynthesis
VLPCPEKGRRQSRSHHQRQMARLLLADRVKGRGDTFLAPLIPALEQHHDVRFLSTGPGPLLAEAIAWADIVWLEWCWDHAVWATTSDCLAGKKCVVRLHSIEALQTSYPASVNWSRVDRLITVGDDITAVLLAGHPSIAGYLQPDIIPNGIDLSRFAAGRGNRHRIAWVGHLEPKKNPMLLLQIAHTLHRADPRYAVHVAGVFTDQRTARYMQRFVGSLHLAEVIHFHGAVADMPAWYADKGVLLSTSMYESFGLNIGEAMAVGAFPVVHDFPGAEHLWPQECLFASIEEAVALIRSARTGLYRDWVAERYGLDRQQQAVLRLLADLT